MGNGGIEGNGGIRGIGVSGGIGGSYKVNRDGQPPTCACYRCSKNMEYSQVCHSSYSITSRL